LPLPKGGDPLALGLLAEEIVALRDFSQAYARFGSWH